MPAVTITLAQLDALGPVDAARAVDAGATLDDLVWAGTALARHDPDVERRLRLWMADCAAHVLHIFERESPTDMRPREAIVAARRYARGEIDAAACDVACDAARVAAWGSRASAWDTASAAARYAAGAAAWVNWRAGACDADMAAACDAAYDAAWAAAWAAACDASWDAARAAACDAAWATVAWAAAVDAARAAACDAARAAEERWQLDRLVAWLSADEPEDWPLD